MTRRLLVLILLVALWMLAVPVLGQAGEATSPPQQAEEIRRALFDAQVALMSGDTQAAVDGIEQAAAASSMTFAALDTGALARLASLFGRMTDVAAAGDTATFASLRGETWSALLQGGMTMTLQAVAAGDGVTAALWLPLRDFRPSNRFSRPDADATLAVAALRRGALDAESAYSVVQTDYYDTYQGQLMSALTDADSAGENGFVLRQAEEAGRAAGYFALLAAAYGEQNSADAQAAVESDFAALVAASVEGDAAAYTSARGRIDAALDGFRAAPLTDEQLARRAGQLSRYVALVPVEYSRAIRDGRVVNPIEVQEALTFHEGATAAFADLRQVLQGLDNEATARAGDLLAGVLDQIQATADPAAVQSQIDELTGLLSGLIPAEWVRSGSASDIDVIVSILDAVGTSAAAGNYTAAESARLEAYATLELGIEQRLRGFAPELSARIESLFWQGTEDLPGLSVLLASQASIVDVRATLSALTAAFSDATLVLGSGQSAPAAVATNAAIIVFREGLEAVLILASLIASLRVAEQRRFRRPLIIGAVLALAATAITWWGATGLLNILLPLGERLEAIVSLIAIGVLLLITNWFFHKTYWTGWMANFHKRKQRLIGGVIVIGVGQMLGLVVLGFTSIYREGFETVLFLQSLVLEAGTSVVLQGVLIGLLGTAIVGLITFSLQVRLPYKKMLIVTGVFIGVVLVTMVGNTVHVMQSVGWLPITPIQGVYFPFWAGQWFGLYATWQGIVMQLAAATFVIGSYFLAEHQSKRRLNSRKAQAQQTPQTAA